MLQANSTTSRPLCTSPSASSMVFPCSAVRSLGEIHLSRSDQLAEGEHDVLTLGQGEPPRLERCPSRLHRAIHVGSRAQNHLAGLFPRGRVVHSTDPRLAPPGELSINPMLDLPHRANLHGRAIRPRPS